MCEWSLMELWALSLWKCKVARVRSNFGQGFSPDSEYFLVYLTITALLLLNYSWRYEEIVINYFQINPKFLLINGIFFLLYWTVLFQSLWPFWRRLTYHFSPSSLLTKCKSFSFVSTAFPCVIPTFYIRILILFRFRLYLKHFSNSDHDCWKKRKSPNRYTSVKGFFTISI